MTDTEVLETSEDGRYRVRLVLDEHAGEPYDDGQSPLLRIETRGYSHRAEHIQIGGRPTGRDDAIEGAIHHWSTCPADSDWYKFERYLRTYHGVTQIETWHSGSFWYVTYDSADWREYAGAPAESADMSEYKAWCNDDVWAWAVEKLVHWTTSNGPVSAAFKGDWEHLNSCGGYYGSSGANGEYLRSCALEALLDAQIDDHGGVFGPLPEPQVVTQEDPDAASAAALGITPDQLRAAVEDMREVAKVPLNVALRRVRECIAADSARERLEYLRGELRGERISWSELHELQGLAGYIETGDVELLEAAGVPEFPDEPEQDDAP